jgi:uncharacterized GH25 family protein
MKRYKSFLAISALFVSTHLSAHSLWINSFESFVHKPGHTTVGLGWGHVSPIDDILNSPSGKIIVEKFTITSPNGTMTKLRIPSSKIQEPTQKNNNFDIYAADTGLQKIALKKGSQKGVYKIEAQSKPTFYTQYINQKGQTRLKLTSKDNISDIKKVLMSVKFEAFATSYLTLGTSWKQPKELDKGLELIPLTDLSNVRIGELVRFKVLFYGKPLSVSAKSMDYISASSNTFGQKDGFALMSYIKDGIAQFRVQSAGQWIVTCNHKDTVDKEGKLKSLFGKVNYVFNSASLTFNVKE